MNAIRIVVLPHPLTLIGATSMADPATSQVHAISTAGTGAKVILTVKAGITLNKP
jgi:hypothetical protein